MLLSCSSYDVIMLFIGGLRCLICNISTWRSSTTYRSGFIRQLSVKMSDCSLSGLDDTQVKLMQEMCILVDSSDKIIGEASKKDCHLLENIDKGMLHRAFSVFIFNSQGQLLLQQRSKQKITFPDHWTNTCCSHPLSCQEEVEEHKALGVIRAAQRKLKHELGIPTDQVPKEAFTYITRILYKSSNVPDDGLFGEHEIDYILFVQKDVDITSNRNEVKDYKYVNRQELGNIMDDGNAGTLLVTPWFKLIVKQFLFTWWDHLVDLHSVLDQNTIHNMVKQDDK